MLSRDLVATHPNLTYTIYDEVTLFLQAAGQISIERALACQQVVFRLASVAGLYLLARATRVRMLPALAIAAAFHFGIYLLGPELSVVDREPTPTAFAIGSVLLAAGLLATGRPLSAGLAGGVAAVYDLRIAAPLWIVLLIMGVADRRVRPHVRTTFPVIAVFALLLANVAQLQPGVSDTRGLLETTPAAIASVERFRTPEVFVGLWTAQSLLWLAALTACCAWTLRQVWPQLEVTPRWLFAGLPAAGLVSVPLSYLLIDRADWSLGTQIQPARTLLFTAVFTFVSAGAIAARERRVQNLLPALAILGLLLLSRWDAPSPRAEPETNELSQWAESNTWGGSMFLFPDLGRAPAPGLFRAEARRAVWVDWQTGSEADYFDSFADEWYRRWQDAMAGSYTPQRLAGLLALPVDYYVLRREHQLANVRPVFADRGFVVYDASDLRRVNGGLK
jgi:hypothetical protein